MARFGRGFPSRGVVRFRATRLGPPLLVAVPAASGDVTGAWSARAVAPLSAAAGGASGAWTGRTSAPLPSSSASVTGTWALSGHLLISVPAADASVTGTWTARASAAVGVTAGVTGSWAAIARVGLSPAAAAVTGSWVAHAAASLPAVEASVTGTWTGRLATALPAAAAVPVAGSWTARVTAAVGSASASVTGTWRILGRLIAVPAAGITVSGAWTVRAIVADPVPTTPLWVLHGGNDVSRSLLRDTLTWETAIGRVPTASFAVSGSIPPVASTVSQGRHINPVVVVGNEADVLFRGEATRRARRLDGGDLRTDVSADGAQSLLSGSPVFPDTWSASRVWDEDGHTWEMGEPAASPVDMNGFATVADAIAAAAAWYRGDPLTLDVGEGLAMGDRFDVRGDMLDSVLEGILDRCGGGFWWLDADNVLHVRYLPPGMGGGEAVYTGPAELLAAWELSDVFPTERGTVLVPTRVSESSSARAVVTGVYADGRTHKASRYVRSDEYGPAITMSVASARGSVVESYARRALKDAAWDTTVTVELPPLLPGDPVPEVGVIVHLGWPEWDGWYLVRGVTARCTGTGDTLEVAEWTLDLGTAPPRSFTREVRAERDVSTADPVGPVMTAQVRNVETSKVDQAMAPGTEQIVMAWMVDGNANRVAMDAGIVTWTLVIDGEEVGQGSAELGWSLQPASNVVEYTPANPLGFAWAVVNCHDVPDIPLVSVRAHWDPPE